MNRFSNRLPFVLIWGVLIGLVGCASLTAPLPEVNQAEIDWLARLQSRGWNLIGRIGVTGARENWHGGLSWEFRDGYDTLKISGPFGQGGVIVEAHQGWIRLRHHDGRVQESDRPGALLHQILGVSVPLDKLHYWILGLPAPGPAQLRYGPGQRLTSLVQAGWEIEFRRYQAEGMGVLPTKIIMTGPEGVRVKLIIDQWETGFEPQST